jgi:DNA-3-methyladenine glycosylase II
MIARFLSSSDPVLASVIGSSLNLPQYYRQGTHFETVSRIIVGQQLSYKAAESIWKRLRKIFSSWTPRNLAVASPEVLRSAGLSASKASFIGELSRRIVAGEPLLSGLFRLKESTVVNRLGSIKGFGPWSIEMFMIFALQYPDVFSCGDAGLRRAICDLYPIEESEYTEQVMKVSERWKPYRSYACRYLWRWLDSR